VYSCEFSIQAAFLSNHVIIRISSSDSQGLSCAVHPYFQYQFCGVEAFFPFPIQWSLLSLQEGFSYHLHMLFSFTY